MTDNLKKECPYYNPDCPKCHLPNPAQSQNWEKEFDEKLSKSIEEMLDYGSETKDFHLKIKSFIHSLLKSQRAELIEEIDELKIPKPKCSCDQKKESCNICAGRYAREAHNQALEDVLTKLKNQ